MASTAPAPNTTDISPAEVDQLAKAMQSVKLGDNAPDDSEIAASDVGQTAAAEQMNKPKPPPLG